MQSSEIAIRVTTPLDGIPLFEYCCIERAIKPISPRISENYIEILCFHRGIQIFTIENTELVVSGGEVLVVPAGLEYSTGHHPQYKSRYHRLQITKTSSSLLGLTAEYSNILYDYLGSLNRLRYHGSDRLSSLLNDSFTHLASDETCVRLKGYGELICFFTSLESFLKISPPQPTPDIYIAYQYINDHITEEISLQDLADLCGISLSYFKERFTSQIGVTPMYYINWRKIAFAKRMIAQDYSVTEVASMLNFTTPAYFSTVFKNYTARTPMQYKQLIDIELRKQHHISPATSIKKDIK